MNRADRRKAQRELPKWQRNRTPDEILNGFAKQGISMQDLKRAYDDGYQVGQREASQMAYRSIYGAICTVLHDEFGFGKKRLYRTLSKVDQRIIESLTNLELIEEAWKKTGLQLCFDKPFDRVEEA